MADVFDVQGTGCRDPSLARWPKLVGENSEPLVLPATSSVEAYTKYLKGRFFWNKRTLEAYRRGIEYFEQALAKDPGYALAYTGIADCWAMLAFDYFGGVPPGKGCRRPRPPR